MEASAAAAAAQCHYQAGRFSRAITEFEQCEGLWNQSCHKLVSIHDHHVRDKNDDGKNHGDDEKIIVADDPIVVPSKPRKRSKPVRVELLALPPLARRADLAMCRFRSDVASGVAEEASSSATANADKQGDNIASSNNKRPTSILWKEALERNTNYFQALRGAAMSLGHTCNLELQARKQQQEILQHTKTKTHKSIQKAMKSTALAMLMAGIAVSHLYLHHTEERSTRGNGKLSNGENAWLVLVDAAVLAADLMQMRKEWMNRLNVNDVSDNDLEEDCGAKLSQLEESLRTLNETICNNNSNLNEEDERGNVAMHSFRSALKVAALATGKLILPKLSASSSKNELQGNKQLSKRQKTKKEDESSSKKDVWDFKYLHSSPMLHSRDRLVDALSFHSAAIKHPQNRELFTDKREVCFEEAVSWENQAGAIYDIDEMESDGCAGYVWKIRNCLHGMELVSAPIDNLESDEQKRTLQSLELLASSSSSQFACDLLGCIHAQRGDYSRALENFQLSLDHGESNDHNADEEIGVGLAERRAIVNMALCFLSMGEVNTPLELFLHLWVTLLESSQSSSPNDTAQPMAMLLSLAGNEMECMANSSIHLGQSTKSQLLWKLFHASSLAQDWSTCLNATEEMLDDKNCDQRHENDLARAFALLQCRRTSAAQETTSRLLPKLASRENKQKTDMLSDQLLLAMAELYHADALLLNEQSMSKFVGNESPLDCTKHAIGALYSVSGKVKESDDKDQKNLSLLELQVTIHNDHGIALIMKGDSVGALRCFREAAEHTSASMATNANTSISWLLLPTYFNLSLLLLRDGHMEESAKSWLKVRGHFTTWQKAARGDNAALKKLKYLRLMAINRHALLIAKRSMQEGAIWDQENIMEWVPPVVDQGDVTEGSTRVGGVDASQITAMDVVLLQYAKSNAEKKSSSSFRSSAGRIGY